MPSGLEEAQAFCSIFGTRHEYLVVSEILRDLTMSIDTYFSQSDFPG